MGGALSIAYLPALGWAFDRTGYQAFMFLTNLSLGFFLATLGAPSYAAQLFSLVVGSVSQYSWGALVITWSVYLVPPHLVGTSNGLLFVLAGVLQVVAVALLPAVGAMMGSATPADALRLPVLLYGAAGLALGGVLNAVLCWQGMPAGFKAPPQPPSCARGARVGGCLWWLRCLLGASALRPRPASERRRTSPAAGRGTLTTVTLLDHTYQ